MALSSRDDLISKLREIAQDLGSDIVPRHEFLRHAKVSERLIQKHFGTYNAMVEAAGLTPRQFPSTKAPLYSDDAMMDEVLRLLRTPDAKLTRVYFEQASTVSASAVERRFGGWRGTIQHARTRLDPDRDGLLMARIDAYLEPLDAARSPRLAPLTGPEFRSEPPDSDESDDEPAAQQRRAPLDPSTLYGDFLNFRGLQHAPVNEQGVVFLFGMVCRELGFVVELVRGGFPDCEAKRSLPGKAGKWQRVRIEFEFESRNFRAHGHDPDYCDLIVCWEHNWAACPLEVLELRTAIARLPPAVSARPPGS